MRWVPSLNHHGQKSWMALKIAQDIFYELLIGLMWGIIVCLACFNRSFALSTFRLSDAMYACFGLSGLIGLIDLNSLKRISVFI